MCTVTWWRDERAGTYGVCFNRDERRTRPPSDPVRHGQTEAGTSYLAPRDSAAGGTWLLANAHGLTVGVLNHYAAASQPDLASARRSRGQIPLAFADCRSATQVAERVGAFPSHAFAPFVLLAWDRVRVSAWIWDGATLASDPTPSRPVTTSSHRSADVGAWRRARYASLGAPATAAALAAYHDDFAHPDPAFNIRMRRPDARTESVCQVVVSAGDVRFLHRRESPDTLAALDRHEAVLPTA